MVSFKALHLGVKGLEFQVQCLGSTVQGSGPGFTGLGLRVWSE